ncbi:hypothetical protein HKD37_14G040978 [Glycine soja]
MSTTSSGRRKTSSLRAIVLDLTAISLFGFERVRTLLVALIVEGVLDLELRMEMAVFFTELYASETRKLVERLINYVIYKQRLSNRIMASPPASPHPPPPPPSNASASPSAVKRTRKVSRLQSLSTRPPGAERLVVHVDPATRKVDGPHRKKLRTYLGIVARDKVDVTYENWKEVPTTQKDLIWEDIQAEFEIPKASDSRTKKKLLQTVGERWGQFKSDLTRKWDVRKKAQKLLTEKTKKKLEEATQSGSIDGVIDPPSLVRRHVKIPLRSRRHRDPSSPMDVRMFSPMLLNVQSTLDVSVLLEPMSPSSITSDRLHGRPAALPHCLLKNCSS